MNERKKPDACRPFRFCGFEIRVIERVAYDADGVESYTYEPMMTQKASVARYTVKLAVSSMMTATNERYTATRNTAQADVMLFDNPNVAQYAAVVSTWRWIQDGMGSRAHQKA